ncbi:hypothetical protein [Nonomuraea longicatena]|uniref:Uncharacterized protein n=1 Tax=Nonomuraea longicatena TaxID=83682 RepID=A0ABN1R1R5_9ACTN
MSEKTNVASSGTTAIQVGKVGPRPENKPTKNKPAVETPEPGRNIANIRNGHARVGVQAGVVVGDISVQM